MLRLSGPPLRSAFFIATSSADPAAAKNHALFATTSTLFKSNANLLPAKASRSTRICSGMRAATLPPPPVVVTTCQ